MTYPDITRTCRKHGITRFRSMGQGKHQRYRCAKCATDAVQKRRLKLKQLAVEHKGGKCEKCGYHKCLAALDFHHLDPNNKDFGIGSCGITYGWSRVREEIEKCILVCANCHRELHNGEQPMG